MNGSDYVWLWTHQKYDWNDRVVRRINTDGDPNAASNDSDILISYDGCGCAGGQVTTIEGENIVETDWQGNNPTTLGRRKQKIYEDILGRSFKTERFQWDGSTVYSSTVHSYNGRDQIVNTRQNGDGTSRDVTMSYDGHGRMATRHYPIENTGAYTSWTYNADDTIHTVTDPRGVVTNFSYYSTTGLLHQLTYDIPSGQTSTVPDTPDVTFAYDNLGNRISMTDGSGSTSYAYDELSRITSETKTITGLSGSFPINYTYNLSGDVKTLSNPQNTSEVATYAFDKRGRILGADRGTGGNIHSTAYRAWGAIKEYRTSPSGSTDYYYDRFTYDSRLNISKYHRGTNLTTETPGDNYQRYADGSVKYVTVDNSPTFDRRYRYDNVGRLIQGQSGFEANGRTDVSNIETPYRNNIAYNAFDETTSVTGKHWPATIPAYTPTISSSTGRVSTSSYDAAGNLTSERIASVPSVVNRTMKYDAAGRSVQIYDPLLRSCCENNRTYDVTYDGNGWKVKELDTHTPGQYSATETKYEFRSTVLGGEVIGKLSIHYPNNIELKRFITPINGVKWGDNIAWSAPEGIRTYGEDGAELDTRGADVGEENPYNGGDGSTGYPGTGGDPTNFTRCAAGGVPQPCDLQARAEQAFARIEGLIQRDSDNRAESRLTKIKRRGETPPRLLVRDASNRTSKPAKLTDGIAGGSVDAASVPDATGENTDGCVYGTDGGPNACTVQSLKWNFDDVDASNGDILPLPTNLRNLVKERAGPDTLCGKAIIRLIDQVAGDTNRKKFKQNAKDAKKGISYIESLFNRVDGKIKLDSSLAPFEADTGGRDFVVGGAKISIGPATTEYVEERKLTASQVNDRYVFTVLHELVHNAVKSGRYTDPQVLRAAIAIMKADGHAAPEYTTVVNHASSRINSFFGTYCPNPK